MNPTSLFLLFCIAALPHFDFILTEAPPPHAASPVYPQGPRPTLRFGAANRLSILTILEAALSFQGFYDGRFLSDFFLIGLLSVLSAGVPLPFLFALLSGPFPRWLAFDGRNVLTNSHSEDTKPWFLVPAALPPCFPPIPSGDFSALPFSPSSTSSPPLLFV